MIQKKVRQEVSVAPYITKVRVSPGSFGKEFHLLTLAEDGVPNRHINRERARIMARDWKPGEGSKSMLTLHDHGGHYKIYDGQHRITAVSEYMSDPVDFEAIVYPPAALREQKERLDLLDALYNPIAQKNVDRFHTRAGVSPWPAIFAEYGLQFAFDRSSKHITWDTIVKARLRTDNSFRLGRVTTAQAKGYGDGNRDLLLDAWLNYPEQDIRRTAETMAWWAPIAQAVYHQERTPILYSVAGLQFAFLLRESNPPHIYAITDLERRLLTAGKGTHAAPPIAGASAKDITTSIRYLLTIANYRRDAVHRAKIFNLADE